MSILPRPGLIYLLTFPNGWRYVGQTYSDFETRINRYRRGGEKGQRKLYQAIQTQGADSFTVVVLMQGIQTLEGLNAAEIYFIELLDTYRNGLNGNAGGQGMLGMSPSQETRDKISASHTGRKHSDAHHAKTGAASKARWADPIWRAKMHEILPGWKHSDEAKAKISTAMKGREFSPKHRAALSAAASTKRDENIDSVLEMHRAGATQKEISRKFDVSEATVNRWLRHAGVPTEEDFYRANVGIVLKMLAEGSTLKQVSDAVGITISRIHAWRKKFLNRRAC